TFALCLALRSLERMPALLALAAGRIAHVDDDGPMAGRSFADMSLHFLLPSSLGLAILYPARSSSWRARSSAALVSGDSDSALASSSFRALASSTGSGNPK